jgi:competence protein ComGC
MRLAPIPKSAAFTVVELIVVLVVSSVIFALVAIFPSERDRYRSTRAEVKNIRCVNNLHQIATAYRVWANDHNGRFPASESIANGGWSELLTNPDQGSLCWTNYAIMAYMFGPLADENGERYPNTLVCPSDERKPARNAKETNRAESYFTNNLSLSYFVGTSADDRQPYSLLGGDRNLGPGSEPSRDYGFSPESGKGNDVAIPTNAQTGSVCWSLKMHRWPGKKEGWGNIILADGSILQVNTRELYSSSLSQAPPTSIWPLGHVPPSPSIRILFP